MATGLPGAIRGVIVWLLGFLGWLLSNFQSVKVERWDVPRLLGGW